MRLLKEKEIPKVPEGKYVLKVALNVFAGKTTDTKLAMQRSLECYEKMVEALKDIEGLIIFPPEHVAFWKEQRWIE